MNSSQHSPPQQQVEEIHLTDYLNVILRRRKIFLFCFLTLFFGVAIYTFVMKPVYEAGATLHVKNEKGGRGGILGDLAMLNSSNPVDAEIEILKSRSNAEEVVKRLHLTWAVSKASNGLTFKIADFASTAETPEYSIELTGPDSYSIKPGDGSPALAGRSGQLVRTGTLTLLLTDIKGSKGDSFRLDMLPFHATVKGLQKGIKASEVGKKTNIIKISYSNTNPVMARDVVNTLVQAYLDQSLSFKTEEASRTVKFVEDQLLGTRNELDLSEKNLQAYKSASGVIKLDTEAEELIKKLSEIEKDRAAVNLSRKQVEFALAALREARRKGQVYTPAVFRDDPLIAGMATRLTELEVQKQAVLSENTKNHPQFKALQAQIDQLQRELESTYGTSQLNLGKQEAVILQQLQIYEAKLRTLPAAERDLARLMRFSKVNADIYMFLLQKHEEARIAKASTISNINVVDPAITPDEPVKPQKKKNLLLGLLVGLMFGVGAAFFLDYLDDTIKDGDEAKRLLGWPILGVIPYITLGAGTKRSDANLISHLKPKSPEAESFRALRTSLHYSSTRKKNNIILITSTFPGEGKTNTSANMAVILAQTGAKVLLVGCDLRAPTLHQIFGFRKTPGLTEYLAGDYTMEDILNRTVLGGLDAISAGTTPPNPAELLGSDQMSTMLEKLSQRYDHIVLDAPPVLAVSDTPILAPACGSVVVVMEAGRVPAKAAQRMRDMLITVGAPVSGIVINDKSNRAASYGYGYGYGYSYGDEHDEEMKNKRTSTFIGRVLEIFRK